MPGRKHMVYITIGFSYHFNNSSLFDKAMSTSIQLSCRKILILIQTMKEGGDEIGASKTRR